MPADHLEVTTRQDGDQWLAWCRSIDVMSQGHTEETALAALKEAIELWFESCLDRGVLAEALEEAGSGGPRYHLEQQ